MMNLRSLLTEQWPQSPFTQPRSPFDNPPFTYMGVDDFGVKDCRKLISKYEKNIGRLGLFAPIQNLAEKLVGQTPWDLEEVEYRLKVVTCYLIDACWNDAELDGHDTKWVCQKYLILIDRLRAGDSQVKTALTAVGIKSSGRLNTVAYALTETCVNSIYNIMSNDYQSYRDPNGDCISFTSNLDDILYAMRAKGAN